jgi:tetratricopeptide (TPR) repeat protein
MRNHIILSVPLLALVACGGAPKSGISSSGKGVPPPPPVVKSDGGSAAPGKAEPKREISKDARKDYTAALEYFNQNDKGGWNESACRSAADKFQSVARDHADLVEAQVMAGLSYERCNLLSDAEKAYQAATHMKGDPTKIAMAVSNLGTLYFKAGKVDGARQYWDTAVKANGKLSGARINLAAMDIEQMRKIKNAKDPSWKKLEEDARINLSNALGANSESVEAYTNYALLYMEGYEVNKNRLDLAKLMLDEAKKRNEKYAPLQNAYGLWYLHKGRLNEALAGFNAAVQLDPKFVEARLNAGHLTVNFRKYDQAKEMFSKALEIAPKNYDAMVGLGFAQRGLNDFDGAEASYKKAIQIDGRQGDAYYNLGVLYKGFKATHSADLPASIKAYQTAKDYFQQFLDKDGDASDKAEAKNNIADCDKVVKQLQDFIRNQANQPPPPTAPAAPAAGAGSGSGSGSGSGAAAPPAK